MFRLKKKMKKIWKNMKKYKTVDCVLCILGKAVGHAKGAAVIDLSAVLVCFRTRVL